MSSLKATLFILGAALLAAPCIVAAQQNNEGAACSINYENHNQIDYGPLVVQDIAGTILDPEKGAIPKACVAIFTEEDHRLIATTQSDGSGRFFLQIVPPGRYRLVIKADPLCVANVPLQVVKRQKKKHVLQVHMKPRGLDSCSYGETVEADKSPKSTSTIHPVAATTQ